MNVFEQILSNRMVVCACISWIAAQLIKTVLYAVIERHFSFGRLVGSGGMPSSHTAFVFSLCLSAGLIYGFDSAVFAVSFALMSVVIYDAMGVRAETGKQSVVINEIIRQMIVEGKQLSQEELKELVGHTPLETLGGVIVGLIVVLIIL